MDEDVQNEFNNLNEKIGRLIQSNHEDQIERMELCAERGIAIGKIEQQLENGEKQEEHAIKKKALSISYDRLIVAIVALGFGAWQIIKELLARR